MRHRFPSVIAAALLVSFTVAIGGDQPLPKDAELLIKEFEEQVDEIERKAEAEIRAKQQKLTDQLQRLRDDLAKDGNFDEALDIHHVVKQMKAVFVEVKWNESWYPAELLETRDDDFVVAFPNDQRQTFPKAQVRHPHHRRPTLKPEPRLPREMILVPSRDKPKDKKDEENIDDK